MDSRSLWLAFTLGQLLVSIVVRPCLGVEVARPRQLWNRMLAAKGGRSRLYSVRTVVQCHRTHFAFSRRHDEYLVWAYAFPDRVWLWADMSSTVLGLDLSMYNLKTESGYGVNSQSGTSKIDGPDGMQRGAHFLHEVQLLYFHETAWMRPELKRVLPKKESPPGTDGIETIVNGERVDFFLNRKTHLPSRITIHHNLSFHARDPRAGIVSYDLSDYRNVSGILLPHREVMSTPAHGMEGSLRFDTQLINVQLRDDLFTSPPSLADGPDGWKSSDRHH